MNPKAYRLPTHTLPRRYDIALDARLGSSTFQGQVTIQLDLTAPRDRIELHARDLRISRAELALDGETLPGEVTLDAERETAAIVFARTLPAGAAMLSLAYEGSVSSGLDGLFVSKDGSDELLCSQCEAVGARAILPCFDEPTFKARFAWKVTTAPDAVVLTNGRLLSTEASADGAAKTWTFAPTAPMSTYLLAVAIGDLVSSPERVVNGVPLRIWALRGKEALGQFALDYTARLLPYYDDYFAVPYHFEKLDQVGIPAFGAGAMENAGLIVSQQVLLLVDPESASQRQEMIASAVIAHEFAHMWFGDLVTMKWWDDIWLNEAFANWMAYHAVDSLSPQYRVWDEVQGRADGARAADALVSSHPIYNPVETPSAIYENFDSITYEKGGAVLRMVHDFLGDEAFRAGLRTYMREFAEGNAAGADLWRNLQQASHQPVGAMMESWVMQAGHPLIAVALDGSQLHLRQRRFFVSPHAPQSDQLWQVPLVVRYEDSAGVHETRHLLGEREARVPLDVTGDLLWCYANAGEVGFYRQQLDASLLNRLLAHLDRLTAAEQKGLLRDQWALVANGSQPIAAYLDVIGALASSDDYTLVGQIVGEHLQRVETLLELVDDAQGPGVTTKGRETLGAPAGFRAWVAAHFGGKMAARGYEPRPGEPRSDGQLRAHVLAAMTHYAHNTQAVEQARQLQAREAADPSSVDADLAPVAVDATAAFGDAATFEEYMRIYQRRKDAGSSPQQVERYVFAFAHFEDPALVERTSQLMASGYFPFQSLANLDAILLAQPGTQVAAWEFTKRFWPVIQERAPFISPFVVEFSGNLRPSLRSDVVAFWDASLHGEYAGPYARALEQIDQRADVLARTRDDLVAYFQSQAPQSQQA